MENAKTILFLWFGDQKPVYVDWTLDNFGKMNPGWNIKYIEYSTDQIRNYKELNDPVMDETMKDNRPIPYIGEVSNRYRKNYLRMNKDKFVVYCDLDCFPIAPFDNFILPENAELKPQNTWVKNNHPYEHISPKLMGCNWFRDEKYQEFIPDIWCMVNNK